MNAWFRIRRLRGPAFVILVGINALLHQWGVLSFGRSWPLYLILAGVFGLAERTALSTSPSPYVADPYGGFGSGGVTSILPPSYSTPATVVSEAGTLTDPDRRP